MATTLNFKDYLDLPQWRPNAPARVANGAAQAIAFDLRNDATRNPFFYLLVSATVLDAYNPLLDEWMGLASPALTGTFGAGASAIFHPSQGPRGTLAAGATTTSIILSTALPAAVAGNQLANRGDGTGFTIRIVGSSAGGSGKVEERQIVWNTAGTTPTLGLSSALSFTPASGDTYELLSGRVFLLSAGALAAGMWKYYDIATCSFSGNLATTNLPGTVGGDSSLVALSELHVPNDKAPGLGFLGVITATASSSTTLTGSAMSSTLQADEYKNFQVRVVQDTTTPTAVGQRRRISGHTGGATGVFTVAAFAVTPSATAQFVIENDDDKIILFTNQTSIYNYNITGNTWDTTTWAAAANAGGAGIVAEQAFGITRDAGSVGRHSHIYRIRGGAVVTIDVLDIAGAATGAWTADIAYGNKGTITTFTTGTCGAYDPVTLGGKFLHLSVNGTQRHARLDLKNRVLEPECYLRFPQGTAVVGARMASLPFIDGATKLGFLFEVTSSQIYAFSLTIQR